MTTAIMPIIALGKSYLATEGRTCTGCAGRKDSELCAALPYCGTGIIFIDAHGPALPSEPVVTPVPSYADGYAAGLATKPAEWTRFEEQRNAAKVAFLAARPQYRNTDPATSKQAAQDVDRKAGRIADLVLVALRDNNLTGKQLAANTGVALNSITPRFAQLARKGLIHAAPAQNSGRETVWALGNGVKV